MCTYCCFVGLCGRANGPARGPRARAGPEPQIWNCFAGRAGPGHNCCGPGPGLIIQFAGRARAGSAQLLWARAGPGPQIIFAGRAWAYISGPCRALVYTHRLCQILWPNCMWTTFSCQLYTYQIFSDVCIILQLCYSSWHPVCGFVRLLSDGSNNE